MKKEKGRSDYKGKGGKSVDPQESKGTKGIPPGMPGSSAPKATKGVVQQDNKGDKGIPPMSAKGKGVKSSHKDAARLD